MKFATASPIGPHVRATSPAGVGLQFVGGNYVCWSLQGADSFTTLISKKAACQYAPGSERRGERLGRLGTPETRMARTYTSMCLTRLRWRKVKASRSCLTLLRRVEPQPGCGPRRRSYQAVLAVRLRRALPLNGTIVGFP